jgi:riboflavin kinase/FMN adenylyltransferase
MRTTFGLVNLRQKLKGTVVVIGVFDGLHLGHRYLIQKALTYSQKAHKKLVCITFHPHPQGEPYLISLRHRLRLIESLGVKRCAVINFTKKFSRLSAEKFIKDIIVELFCPVRIFVGEGFRFGYRAQGTIGLLKRFEKEYGYTVMAVKELKVHKHKISSYMIRAFIKEGRLKEAQGLLGRRISVLGTVIKGFKRGRIVGYPTANINPHHEVLPKAGVYAVKVLYNKRNYSGLCNIGARPTFVRVSALQTIEVHIFGFKKNIYGEDIEIQFVSKIRDEERFPSIRSLSGQIRKDSKKAIAILKHIA